jgi:hypothetical protein
MWRLIVILLLCGVGCLQPTLCLAQPPDTVWTRLIGGPQLDEGLDLEPLPDGGLIVCGIYDPPDQPSWQDAGYFIRFNAEGDTLWTKAYTDSGLYVAYSIKPVEDGSFIFTGSGRGPEDIVVGKLDSLGNLIWLRRYAQFPAVDMGFDIIVVSSGGYAVAAAGAYRSSPQAAMILRLTEEGDVIWNRFFGGAGNEVLEHIVETSDGGFAAAGARADSDLRDHFYLVKVNSQGDSVWSQSYVAPMRSWGKSVVQTDDNGFMMTGHYGFYGDPVADLRVIRTDSLGNIIWDEIHGGAGVESGYEIIRMESDNYLISGSTSSHGAGAADAYLIKIDDNGDTLRTQTYGGPSQEWASAIVWLGDNEFAFAGGSYAAGTEDVYVARLGISSAVSPGNNSQLVRLHSVEVFPNPFNSITTLSLSLPVSQHVRINLFDITGRHVQQINDTRLTAGEHSFQINAAGFPSGLYFVRAQTDLHSTTQKLILLK